MHRKIKQILLFVFATSALSACLDMEHKGKRNDIPTKGELEIAVDLNDSLLFVQLIDRFHDLYPKAHIKPKFMAPIALLEGVRDKQISALYINHAFDSAMIDALESRQIKVRSHDIGMGATAFIVNRSNPNSRISVDSLCSMLSGKCSAWGRSNEKLVFAMLKNDLIYNDLAEFYKKNASQPNEKLSLPKVVQFASPQAVFDYVKKTPGALGFVGSNWIADRGDTLARFNRKQVKVLEVQHPVSGEFHLPYQSQVFAKQYPFIRIIMGYDLQGYSGLAQGFLAFCCDQSGQVILKKSGLSPALPPARTIQLEN
jgi:phosphate transport system substrate-binding protein